MTRTAHITILLAGSLLLAGCGGPTILQGDSNHVTIEGSGDAVRKLAVSHCDSHGAEAKYTGQSREDVAEFDCVIRQKR